MLYRMRAKCILVQHANIYDKINNSIQNNWLLTEEFFFGELNPLPALLMLFAKKRELGSPTSWIYMISTNIYRFEPSNSIDLTQLD